MGLSVLQGAAYGAAPALIGKSMKYLGDKTGLNKALDGYVDKGVTAVKNAVGGSKDASLVSASGESNAVAQAYPVAEASVAESALPAAEAGGAAAATEGAGTAAATAAAETAAAEGSAATIAGTNAWNPVGWAAAAYGLGKAFDLFADGGAVGKKQGLGLSDIDRKDFRPGGAVHGPGTETSDSIPAWLSKGEFVLNAEAVKMVGKGQLNKLNNAGLEKRATKEGGLGLHLAAPGRHETKEHELGLHLAGGGFLGGNMGIALGAAADEMGRQRMQARADKAEAWADEQRVRQRKEWGDEDAIGNAFSTAMGAGQPAPGLGLDSVSGGRPDMTPDPNASQTGPGLGQPQMTPAPKNLPGLDSVTRPQTEEAGMRRLLNASNAAMQEAGKRGNLNLFAKHFDTAASVREKLRATALDNADRQYQMTGDWNVYRPAYNDFVADGHQVDGIQKQADGSYVMTVTTPEGNRVQRPVKDDATMKSMVMSMTDPAAMRKLEAAKALKGFELLAEQNKAIATEEAKAQAKAKYEPPIVKRWGGTDSQDVGIVVPDGNGSASIQWQDVPARQPSPPATTPLSVSQQNTNKQIEISRRKLAGLDPADIRRKTQKFTDTGRGNPDFDPSLAQHARLAAKRKYGSDDWYDAQGEDAGDQKPQGAADRFAADPAMKGFTLGKQNDNGVEVFNSAGKLIGHYH